MSDKARLLVFDIETYHTRDAAVVERLSTEAVEKRPAQNVLKELKLEWDTEAAREARALEAVRRTSLDWLLAETLCCSFRADGVAYGVQMMFGNAEPERVGLQMLADAWNELCGEDTVWIGHNVLGFDLPIILNRLRHFDIMPPEHFPRFVNGRWHGRVYDTMKRTPSSDNGLGFVSFEKVCQAYGVPGAKSVLWNGEPMHGGRVAEAFDAGEYELIQEYCASDVEVNEQLYLRMTCDDTWGTFDTRQGVAERLAEIDGSDLSAGGKALAKVLALEDAGLLPRS